MRCRYGLPFAAKESSARSETGGPRRRTQKRGNRRLSNHKFKIGQLVSYFCRERATTGLYTATQLLPPEGDDFQYRIRNASERASQASSQGTRAGARSCGCEAQIRTFRSTLFSGPGSALH
jgi:hypothetical protein